jgi:hypothetical protein
MRACALLFAWAAGVAHAGGNPDACREGGAWSIESRPLFTGWPAVNHPLRAPDGRAVLRIDEGGVGVDGSQGRSLLEGALHSPYLIEAQWSPDSSYLATTDSDGGSVGTWITAFFAIGSDGRATPIELLRNVSREAVRLPRCFEREDPNIGMVAWLRGGREALVVAEVPPHSSCRNLGKMVGYRISVPDGKILARVRDPQSRAEWRRHMGCNVRSALFP